MSFENKVVLVTGAGSGIGADAAENFAKNGAKVALIDINEFHLNQVFAKIVESNAPAPFKLVADVTTDAEKIINETVQHFDKLDVLVNSAGIGHYDNLSNFNMQKFDVLMSTNVKSVIALTKFAAVHLEKTEGNIVNLSSVSGVRPAANYLSYGISKASINHFTKCMAMELAQQKIRVNAIAPTVINTPMCRSFRGLDSPQATEHRFKYIGEKHPLGRIGNVSDTTAAILYLASNDASFITGTILAVDGGAAISMVQTD